MSAKTTAAPAGIIVATQLKAGLDEFESRRLNDIGTIYARSR